MTDYAGQIIKLGNWVKKNVLVTAFMAFLGLGGYAAYHATSANIEKAIEIMKPSPKVETTSFLLSFGRGQKVTNLIETVRDETGASRLILAEFHNGKSSLGAVPWSYSSARYAAVGPGIAYDMEGAQSVPNSMHSEMFAKIWADPRKPVCVYIRTHEVKSSLMRAQLANRGTVAYVQCPIQRADGTPLGTIVASFVRIEPTNPDEVVEKIRSLASDLVPLIGRE